MPRNTDRPLTAKEQKFIRFYCKPGVRDLEKAAQLAGYKAAEGKRLWKKREIRADIERRLAVVEREQTLQDAKEAALTNDFLDKRLAQVANLDEKKFGPLVLETLKFAYLVQGRIRDGNREALSPGGGQDEGAELIYRAKVQQVTQTQIEVTHAAPPAPLPGKEKQVIEATPQAGPGPLVIRAY